MRILKLQATFGCLENATLELAPGRNLLVMPNGSGKSTWCAFLVAMFYGLDPKSRTSRTSLSDKERYLPWSGAPMAGRMDLDWDGQPITIERGSQGKGVFNQFRAYDTRTGRDLPGLTAETCGQTLLGVERSVYLRSGFIGQGAMAVTADAALEQRLSALVSTGEETVSRRDAEQTLKKYRNRLRHNQTGRIPALERDLADLDQTLQLLKQGAQTLKTLQQEQADLRRQQAEAQQAAQSDAAETRQTLLSQLDRAQRQADDAEIALRQARDRADRLPDADSLQALDKALAQLEQDEAAAPDGHTFPAGWWIVFGVLLILAAAAAVAFWPWGLAALIVPVACLVWCLTQTRRSRAELESRQQLDAQKEKLLTQVGRFSPCQTVAEAREAVREALAQPDQVSQLAAQAASARTAADILRTATDTPITPTAGQDALSDAIRENETAQARLRGALDAAGDPRILAARRKAMVQELAELQSAYDAATAALESLDRAAAQLETRFAPQLGQRAAALFSALTDGAYDRVLLDRDLQLHVGRAGDFSDRTPLALSQGTADQLYLSLRLAIAAQTVPGCPLVLDDALTNFDDRRLANAMALLDLLAKTQQILIFSCSNREQNF